LIVHVLRTQPTVEKRKAETMLFLETRSQIQGGREVPSKCCQIATIPVRDVYLLYGLYRLTLLSGCVWGRFPRWMWWAT